MFNGYMSRQEMSRFHPLELATLEAGGHPKPPPDEVRRRQRRFVPMYGFSAVVLLVGIWLFVSFEDTAIETIEPIEQAAVFVPALETTTTLALTTTTAGQVTTTSLAPTTTAAADIVVATWADTAAILTASRQP